MPEDELGREDAEGGVGLSAGAEDRDRRENIAIVGNVDPEIDDRLDAIPSFSFSFSFSFSSSFDFTFSSFSLSLASLGSRFRPLSCSVEFDFSRERESAEKLIMPVIALLLFLPKLPNEPPVVEEGGVLVPSAVTVLILVIEFECERFDAVWGGVDGILGTSEFVDPDRPIALRISCEACASKPTPVAVLFRFSSELDKEEE